MEESMTVTQIVEVPEDRRLTVDVPDEVPAGFVTISFTPVGDADTMPAKFCNAIDEAMANGDTDV